MDSNRSAGQALGEDSGAMPNVPPEMKTFDHWVVWEAVLKDNGRLGDWIEAGVPERPKGPVRKTGGASLRGFESRPLL